MVFLIATTRFNNNTFLENKRWRETNLPQGGCIYKVPIQIASTIPQGANLYILEMNNSTNQIEGIGYITKQLKYNYTDPIYEDRNYNRYTYVGTQRVDRKDLLEKNPLLIQEIETNLFKGKGNMKRGQSITRLPPKRCHPHYISFMRELFA